ncbi:hypothetical protein E2320_010614, partial [Naja naja]
MASTVLKQIHENQIMLTLQAIRITEEGRSNTKGYIIAFAERTCIRFYSKMQQCRYDMEVHARHACSLLLPTIAACRYAIVTRASSLLCLLTVLCNNATYRDTNEEKEYLAMSVRGLKVLSLKLL